MQIDWLTVIAQIVNFLVLVWLLKRFLYQPVIHAMDRREQHIAESLHEAQRREQEALGTTQGYQRKLATLDEERMSLLDRARASAESARLTLLDEARREVAEKRAHWQRQVEEEQQHFLRGLTQKGAEAIQAIARHALTDLADADLEEQIIQALIERLRSLDAHTRTVLAGAAGPIRITTGFALDASLRNRVTRAVHEHLNAEIEVHYGESPRLLCGIEMTVSGHRLGWSLDDYLQTLEHRLQAQMEPVRVRGE